MLICGPIGSGKGHLAKESLKRQKYQEFTFITYGDLLGSQTSPRFYESPRQRLGRLIETALVKGEAVILGNLEELIEEPGLWFTLTLTWFERLEQAKIPVICTINSDSKQEFDIIKDHFLHIVNVPKSGDLRFADLKALERECEALKQEKTTVLDKMVLEGRTCSQLTNSKENSIETVTINEENSLKLDCIYGIEEEIKDLLLESASFKKGLKGSRGVLLYGPPGTGKTCLALALAGSLGKGTRFISLAAADLLRAEIGTSEIKLKEAFNLAKASQPAIIFFDEIDAIFPENPPIHLLSLQHQLIAEFDAMEIEQNLTGKHVKVFVLAASNYLDKISKRILSVERIEEQVEIKLPDFMGRFDILKKDLLKEKSNLNDEFIETLALKTEKKSPADLTKLIQDARKNCWSRGNSESVLDEIDFQFLK